MAVIDIKEVSRLNGTQILHSKANFDTVEGTESEKPPELTEGLSIKNPDSAKTKSVNGELDNPILPDMPNLYKQTGISMSKIPFSFTAFPDYFFTSGWISFDDPEKLCKRMKFLYWSFKKCSTTTKRIPFDGKMITLEPYQFIYGRSTSAKEAGMTEEQLRHQLKCHENANFIKKAPSSTPRRFTIYTWVTESFVENNPQLNPQLNPHKSDDRRKKRDKEDHPPTPSFEKKVSDGRNDDFFQKNKKKEQSTEGKIHVCRDVYLTQHELDDCINFHGSREKVEMQINKILDCPSRKTDITRWAYSIKKWTFPNEVVDRRVENEHLGKKILSIYRNTDGWIVEHYRDTKKDATGLLFQNSRGYGNPVFILYSDPEFEKKVKHELKTHKMEPTQEKK